MNTGPALKAPFPAFGGKSRVAAEVWRRFGDVRNYVEPFCFSAAVLLKRPGFVTGAVETINDRNLFVANFSERAKNASRTFVGIAEAMAEQWGGLEC